MRTDTAHEHWNDHWKAADTKWTRSDPEVSEWARNFQSGMRVLDLGAGVGRHALEIARYGHTVHAVDAAPEGLAHLARSAEGMPVTTYLAEMTDLPLADQSVDHVLSWNVIYHGDEVVVRRAIAEIARVLKPGGTFLGTMLSKRRVPVERAKAKGREISRNTWVFEGPGDKVHPHYFCSARELLDLFSDFEPWRIQDREHENPGTWHWHLLLERL